ncbi:MAG: T9SS type A sorting domain-containing protein, partial [Bacteroidota bacterium]
FYGIYFNTSPPCWNPPFEYSSSQSLTPGLGRTRYSWYYVYESLWIDLVYFKKGTEVWGTPVSTSCNTLLSDELRFANYELRITIYPNPVKSQVIIQIDEFKQGSSVEFRLFDFLGREVYRTEIRQSPYAMNRPPLQNGLYIWQVTGEEETSTGKLILE